MHYAKCISSVSSGALLNTQKRGARVRPRLVKLFGEEPDAVRRLTGRDLREDAILKASSKAGSVEHGQQRGRLPSMI
eukprot:6186427-Pleurochrysis_carterae.AAC.6